MVAHESLVATKHSSGSSPICAAVHDRIRPEASARQGARQDRNGFPPAALAASANV
jgi:hypothetical protein